MIILALIGFSIRLYHVNAPIADWHSWRQVDTAAVARNYLKNGINLLRPRYDDLSNIQTGKDNPMGWRMVEFPLYQFIAVGFKQVVGIFTIEVWLRLVSIAAITFGALLLGLLVSHYSDLVTGIVVEAVMLFLPYSIYYGRTILPDISSMTLAIASVYGVAKAFTDTEKKSITIQWFWIFLGSLFAACSLLVKPVGGFLLLPAAYLFVSNHKHAKHWIIGLFVYSIIGLLPLVLWRQWILQFPEGIASYQWLLNEGGIRLKGAWFYWLFAERLGKLILGYWGLIPFGIGIMLAPSKKEGWLYRWWGIGILLFWIIVARGNVQHDYYQILVIPVVSIFVAKGFVFLFRNPFISKRVACLMSLVTVAFMFAFSWYTIRTYFWINRPEIIEAGRAADALLPKGAKVIAPYNGDTTFLYQTNRAGWPIGFDIDGKIAMGATAYVTVSPTDNDFETKTLAEKYTVLVRNDTFAIIDLTKQR